MSRAPLLRRDSAPPGPMPVRLSLPPTIDRSTEARDPGLRLRRGQRAARPRSPLHQRLALVVADQTVRQVASATGLHAETVRRYLRGQSPSVEFLAGFCRAYDVNGHWLLTGEGAPFVEEMSAEALRVSSASALLRTLADRFERS